MRMDQKVKELVTEKVKELMAAPSCCAEAKEVAQKWLDADGDAESTKNLIAELEEDITTIDDLIALLESDLGVQFFGEERAKAMLAHGKEIKAAGAKYCDCPACAAAEAILNALQA